jgi:hypothetical protein
MWEMCYSGNMKKQKAGERKRTVTITIGPETAKLLDDIALKQAEHPLEFRPNRTQICGVALDHGLESMAEARGLLKAGTPVCHYF